MADEHRIQGESDRPKDEKGSFQSLPNYPEGPPADTTRRVHCRYCGQTFLSDDLERCSACLRVGGVTEVGKDSPPV